MLAVHTHSTKKRKESKALVSRIKCTSFEMFPCSRYKRQNTKCVVLDKENSSRCSKCVLCKDRCNVKGIPIGEQRSLEQEETCLKLKKERALQLIVENTACVLCLEKQQKFLKSKGKDMVRCGLKTLNKLEKVKEKERQIETKRVTIKAVVT